MHVIRPWAFAVAKDFRERETHIAYSYEKNRLEKLGSLLRGGVDYVLDFTLKEIKNPVMVVALTALAALSTTFVFYPHYLPFVNMVKPWMIRAAMYGSLEATILGIGLRNLGRLNNDLLREKWNRGELEPVYIGDRKVIKV